METPRMTNRRTMLKELSALVNQASSHDMEIVERYVQLATTAKHLEADIRRLGTTLEVINNGNTYYKTNPAISELTKVSKELNNLRAFFDEKRKDKDNPDEIDISEFDD